MLRFCVDSWFWAGARVRARDDGIRSHPLLPGAWDYAVLEELQLPRGHLVRGLHSGWNVYALRRFHGHGLYVLLQVVVDSICVLVALCTKVVDSSKGGERWSGIKGNSPLLFCCRPVADATHLDQICRLLGTPSEEAIAKIESPDVCECACV